MFGSNLPPSILSSISPTFPSQLHVLPLLYVCLTFTESFSAPWRYMSVRASTGAWVASQKLHCLRKVTLSPSTQRLPIAPPMELLMSHFPVHTEILADSIFIMRILCIQS